MFFLLDYQVFEYEFDEVSRVKVVALVVVYHSCEWQNFGSSHVIFELYIGFMMQKLLNFIRVKSEEMQIFWLSKSGIHIELGSAQWWKLLSML